MDILSMPFLSYLGLGHRKPLFLRQRLLSFWVGCLAVLLCGLSSSAWAYDNSIFGNHSIRNWNSEDGLPHNTVTAIVQSRDGYLWVGTTDGLARFNGLEFTVYDLSTQPAMQDAAITALYEDKDGVLWLAHGVGRISRIVKGKLESVPFVAQGQRICTLFANESHRVCVCMLSGEIYEVETGRRMLTPEPCEGVLNLRYARGEDGRFLVSAYSRVYELKGDHFELLPIKIAVGSQYLRALGVARAGGWWLVIDDCIWRWTEDKQQAKWGDWGNQEVSSLIELSSGQLAFSTNFDGIQLLSERGQRISLTIDAGQIPNWVRAIYEDREGILWAGAGSAGLFSISSTCISTHKPPDGWKGFAELSVAAARDGSVWVGTEGGGLYRLSAAGWKNYGPQEGLTNVYVWSLAEDSQGRIWAGTWDGNVYYCENDRFVEASDLRLKTPVFALQFSSDGRRLYAGTGAGLYCTELGTKGWLFHQKGTEQVSISDLLLGGDGELWLAMGKSGLGRWQAGQVVSVPLKGLNGAAARVQCLLKDEGLLWVGTAEDGLYVYRKGLFTPIRLNARGPVKSIYHIEDDGRRLWLNTSTGIMRLDKADIHRSLETAEPVFVKTYDREDGMPATAFSGSMKSAACRAQDGALWLANTKGLIRLDPAKISELSSEPPIRMESMLVDGRSCLGAENEPIVLSPDQSHLEFRFAVLSYRAPRNNHYRYRLVGFEDSWIDCGPTRVAKYTRLPAGDYRFEVMGADADGPWSPQVASVSFSVSPFYWNTWWFRAAVVSAFVFGIVWLVRSLTRRRLQRRVAKLEQERQLEHERTRIARDIHDEVGSSITRITMLSDSLQGASPGDLKTAGRIRQISIDVTETLDEIVWAINPSNDTLKSLACYMAHHVQERVGEAGFSCRIEIPLNLPELTLLSPIRHNLVMAFKEAVSNALLHSGGNELHVELVIDGAWIRVGVADNGRGLPVETKADSFRRPENGLVNMRARMTAVGGSCEFHSEPGRGTRVLLSIPVNSPGRSHPVPV